MAAFDSFPSSFNFIPYTGPPERLVKNRSCPPEQNAADYIVDVEPSDVGGNSALDVESDEFLSQSEAPCALYGSGPSLIWLQMMPSRFRKAERVVAYRRTNKLHLRLMLTRQPILSTRAYIWQSDQDRVITATTLSAVAPQHQALKRLVMATLPLHSNLGKGSSHTLATNSIRSVWWR